MIWGKWQAFTGRMPFRSLNW